MFIMFEFLHMSSKNLRMSILNLITLVRNSTRLLSTITSNICGQSFQSLLRILPKSTRKRSQIDENASLERFRRQIAPRSASRAVLDESRKPKSQFFAQNVAPRVGFGTPEKIEYRSNIALLSIGWRLDPLKMVSGRGFGKDMKFR